MSRNLSRYALIFLLLALSGLIFLLRNIRSVEVRDPSRLLLKTSADTTSVTGLIGPFSLLSQSWNCHTVSTIHQLQSRIQSSLISSNLPKFHHNHTFCSQLGQKPSPEDELEERYLLDTIAWPGPSPRAATAALPLSSDPSHSLFTILPTQGGRQWHVGDVLEVLVQMHDFHGRPKRHGGDFLLARLHSPELGAGVAGKVLDHHNGFYSALFPLLWVGTALVEVSMVHSSEAVAVLQRLREERSDRVFFQSLFRLGSMSETTVCNMCLPPHQPLCNYTDLSTGEPWYCYKPKMLSCDTRINHAKGGYLKHLISNKEALLFQRFVSLKVQCVGFLRSGCASVDRVGCAMIKVLLV